MQNPKSVLTQFLSRVADTTNPEYGRHYLTHILTPSLELEAAIRESFQKRGTPSLHSTDPHMGLFNIFNSVLLPGSARVVHPRTENTPITTPSTPSMWPPSPASSAWCGQCGDDLQSTRYSYYSEAAHVICSFPLQTMFPLRRALFREPGTPCMVGSLSSFLENLRIFTHGALADITKWDNMVITGGAVVAALCGLPRRADGTDSTPLDINQFYQSDTYWMSGVDIFLHGLTVKQALARAEEICSDISKSTLWPLTIIRKADRVSIHGLYPCRPIHIHLKLFASPAEIVANCDLDCACCIYDGSSVYMNPRGLIALMLQTNTLDLCRWSPSYELRLARYAERGFEVYVSFLDRVKVDYGRIYNRNLTYLPTGLSRLLILELLRYMPDHLHALNASESLAKRVAPDNLENPSIYAPIDKCLMNDLDVLWSQIPYGPLWNNKSLHTLVANINKELNQGGENSINRCKLHRHPICVFSNFSDCLQAICDNCPEPQTKAEKNLLLSEEGIYCRGPLMFYPMGVHTKDLSQILGKTTREQQAIFTANTYCRKDQVRGEEDPILANISRELWVHCVLDNNMRPELHQRFERYHDTEGAAPTVVSLFRFYAEVDSFLDFLYRREKERGTEALSQPHSHDCGSLMDTSEHQDAQSSRYVDPDTGRLTTGGFVPGPALNMFSNSKQTYSK